MDNPKKPSFFRGIQKAPTENNNDPVFLEKEKHRIDRLRKKVFNKQTIRNPIAKELLQGDGRLSGKVIHDKQHKRDIKPKHGKNEWLKKLDDDQED